MQVALQQEKLHSAYVCNRNGQLSTLLLDCHTHAHSLTFSPTAGFPNSKAHVSQSASRSEAGWKGPYEFKGLSPDPRPDSAGALKVTAAAGRTLPVEERQAQAKQDIAAAKARQAAYAGQGTRQFTDVEVAQPEAPDFASPASATSAGSATDTFELRDSRSETLSQTPTDITKDAGPLESTADSATDTFQLGDSRSAAEDLSSTGTFMLDDADLEKSGASADSSQQTLYEPDLDEASYAEGKQNVIASADDRAQPNLQQQTGQIATSQPASEQAAGGATTDDTPAPVYEPDTDKPPYAQGRTDLKPRATDEQAARAKAQAGLQQASAQTFSPEVSASEGVKELRSPDTVPLQSAASSQTAATAASEQSDPLTQSTADGIGISGEEDAEQTAKAGPKTSQQQQAVTAASSGLAAVAFRPSPQVIFRSGADRQQQPLVSGQQPIAECAAEQEDPANQQAISDKAYRANAEAKRAFASDPAGLQAVSDQAYRAGSSQVSASIPANQQAVSDRAYRKGKLFQQASPAGQQALSDQAYRSQAGSQQAFASDPAGQQAISDQSYHANAGSIQAPDSDPAAQQADSDRAYSSRSGSQQEYASDPVRQQAGSDQAYRSNLRSDMKYASDPDGQQAASNQAYRQNAQPGQPPASAPATQQAGSDRAYRVGKLSLQADPAAQQAVSDQAYRASIGSSRSFASDPTAQQADSNRAYSEKAESQPEYASDPRRQQMVSDQAYRTSIGASREYSSDPKAQQADSDRAYSEKSGSQQEYPSDPVRQQAVSDQAYRTNAASTQEPKQAYASDPARQQADSDQGYRANVGPQPVYASDPAGPQADSDQAYRSSTRSQQEYASDPAGQQADSDRGYRIKKSAEEADPTDQQALSDESYREALEAASTSTASSPAPTSPTQQPQNPIQGLISAFQGLLRASPSSSPSLSSSFAPDQSSSQPAPTSCLSPAQQAQIPASNTRAARRMAAANQALAAGKGQDRVRREVPVRQYTEVTLDGSVTDYIMERGLRAPLLLIAGLAASAAQTLEPLWPVSQIPTISLSIK